MVDNFYEVVSIGVILLEVTNLMMWIRDIIKYYYFSDVLKFGNS